MSPICQNCRRGRVVLDRIQGRILDPGFQGCATADIFVAGTIANLSLDRRVKLNMLSLALYFGGRVFMQGHNKAAARLPRIPFAKLFVPFAPPLTPFHYRNERTGVGR